MKRGTVAMLFLALGPAVADVTGSWGEAASLRSPVALAPVEIHATGFLDPWGLAVDPDGDLLVADRRAGTITRLGRDGSGTILARGLDRPVGLAIDLTGRVLVAEEHAGRVSRLGPSGRLIPLIAGVRQPRWVAVHPDGTVFVSARGLTRTAEPEPDDDSGEAEMVLARGPDGSVSVFADGLHRLQALAIAGDAVIAVCAGGRDVPRSEGAVLRIPILATGEAGPVISQAPADILARPIGVVRDRLAALFVSADALGLGQFRVRDAIGKVHPDGHISLFAHGLQAPRGLALDTEGHLYASAAGTGRVLRFRAPAPPTLVAPDVTGEAIVTVAGSTEPAARVDLFVNDAATPLTVIADVAGAFAAPVSLALGVANTLLALATTHGGGGLTSSPATATILHDAAPPSLVFLAPPEGAHLRLAVPVRAEAADDHGVTTVTITVDGQSLPVATIPAPPAARVVASATWDTGTVPDGGHSLVASTADRTGAAVSATRVVLVDNTPPETRIVAGPEADVAEAAVEIAFAGTDNLTPEVQLAFAWRLDGGPWGGFSTATTAALTALSEGPHTVDVAARDLAGNEDPTPARLAFTVRLGPRIVGHTPAAGEIGTLVTINGTGFEPGATQVTFSGVPAVLRSVTATTVVTTVPVGASSGPLTVTTPRGAASVSFAVPLGGDFALVPAPGGPDRLRVVAGDQGTAHVGVSASGHFTGLVQPSLDDLPAGVSVTLSPPVVGPGGATSVTFVVAPGTPPGTYGVSVAGHAQVDGHLVTRTAPILLDVLSPGTAALSGRVLTADAVPSPIAGATITLGSAFTVSDGGGNFVLLAPPPGPGMLLVDGRTASTPAAQYPPVEIQVDVASSGVTRVPFPVYLPRLDTAHPVTLPLDPSGAVARTVEATTPLVPGLVVTIPQGTRITGPDGAPVRQVTITPVPIDRSPMPFPPGVAPPMLFTLQPGGALPSQPLPITFPNPRQAAPASRADLYFFDLAAGTWVVWGRATVDPDGRRFVPDPGAGLPRFAWHMPCGEDCYGAPGAAPPGESRPWPTGGDPVNLATGQLQLTSLDLLLRATLPIGVTRTYATGSSRPGLFGIGSTLAPYDTVLTARGESLSLVFPDGSQLLFEAEEPGRWLNRTAPAMRGASLTRRTGDFLFELRFEDGSRHLFDRVVGFADLAALSAIVDRHGNTVTITREGSGPGRSGRITRVTEPTGRSLLLAYDGADRIVSAADPLGRVVRYAYDDRGRLASVLDPAGGVTRFTYDDEHRLLAITDPRGITYLTNEYGDDGRVTRQIQADGGVWRFEYVGSGRVVTRTAVTDPAGHTTVYRFDALGFLVARTDAAGQSTTLEYEPGTHRLLAVTDRAGHVTRYAYDAGGHVNRLTDAAGQSTSLAWELTSGALVSITDPLGGVTRLEYDGTGSLAAIIDPLGARTTLVHDAAGQLLARTDPLGHTTTFGFDAHGNLVSVSDPLGHTTTREFDAAGRVVREVDPRGKVTHFTRDALDRLTVVTDPLGGTTRFAYDGNGNLVALTDARGNATTYAYDVMDRLVVATDPLGASESFDYDLSGRLVSHTDRAGQSTALAWDPLGSLVTARFGDGSTLGFLHDPIGQLLEADDSAGGHLVNAYDGLGRLTEQTTELGTVAYQYDALGRRLQMDLPGEPAVTYAWDQASRLTAVRRGDQEASIEHDPTGRRSRLVLLGRLVTEYHYDAASRLQALAYHGPGGPLGELRYQYDPAGNRVAAAGVFARTRLPDPVPAATYDAANRLLTFGDTVLDHDASGHLLGDGVTTYVWDARHRLVAVTGPTGETRFTYDPLGRRAARWVGGVETAVVHDLWNPVHEVSETGPPVTWLTGLVLDEFFLRIKEGDTRLLLTDALRSTVAEMEASGTVLAEHTYEPFGRSFSTAATPNAFRFTGREQDPTGLLYYRARYYHPRLGRFLSEDPIGLAGGDPNLYAYVRNRPTTRTDPFGLWSPEFHYGVTLQEARVCGLSGADAEALARAARGVDFSYGPLPSLSTLSPWSVAHAMPGSPWPLHAGGQVVRARGPLLASDPAASLAALGQGIHAFQDAYAHDLAAAGMSAHLAALLGLTTNPDSPDEAVNALRARAARAATTHVIRDYMKARGDKPECPGAGG